MAVFESKLDKKSDAYAKNRADQLEKLAHLRGLEQRAVDASERRRPRFEERGQLTPRDRLARLLDPGMPFLTLYNMAAIASMTRTATQAYPAARCWPVSAM